MPFWVKTSILDLYLIPSRDPINVQKIINVRCSMGPIYFGTVVVNYTLAPVCTNMYHISWVELMLSV